MCRSTQWQLVQQVHPTFLEQDLVPWPSTVSPIAHTTLHLLLSLWTQFPEPGPSAPKDTEHADTVLGRPRSYQIYPTSILLLNIAT